MSNIKGVPVNHRGVFTVATLPVAPAKGDIAFATNALKGAETAGNGTGNLVFFDGVAWRRSDTGATATA